jgi:hypothetical protein
MLSCSECESFPAGALMFFCHATSVQCSVAVCVCVCVGVKDI